MPKAARLGDPIGHSPTMNWLLAGLLAGAAIAVVGIAIVGTGGLAAVAIVGAAAAGGAGIGEAMSTMSWAPKEVCGAIAAPCSLNVFTNALPAARAHVDMALCAKHAPAPLPIASGSKSVYINGMPAARVDDKIACSAVITSGSSNVFIGGDTIVTDQISPENLVPPWVHVALLVVGVGAAVILAGPVIAVGGLVGGVLGGIGGGMLGGAIFGEGSDGQKWSSLGGSIVGGMLGAKAAPGAWNFLKRVEVEPGTLGMNGGNLRLRPVEPEPVVPPTTPPRGPLTAAEYRNLRNKTPSKAIQDQVNENVNLPMDDPALPGLTINKTLHADHIVPMKAITEKPGFVDLTEANQLKVLNNPDNFIGLSETANTSKGAKTYEQWVLYKKGNVAVDPVFRARMMQEETRLHGVLQEQINTLLAGQQ
jgi:uncharacterized Zn-binding protein involved in type VI secretion